MEVHSPSMRESELKLGMRASIDYEERVQSKSKSKMRMSRLRCNRLVGFPFDPMTLSEGARERERKVQVQVLVDDDETSRMRLEVFGRSD